MEEEIREMKEAAEETVETAEAAAEETAEAVEAAAEETVEAAEAAAEEAAEAVEAAAEETAETVEEAAEETAETVEEAAEETAEAVEEATEETAETVEEAAEETAEAVEEAAEESAEAVEEAAEETAEAAEEAAEETAEAAEEATEETAEPEKPEGFTSAPIVGKPIQPSQVKKKKKGNGAFMKILTVLCIGVFLFSGYKLATALLSYGESKKNYNDLQQYVVVDVDPTKPSTGKDEPEIVDPYQYLKQIGADFDALSAINDDVVSWIQINGTSVNYPVTQTADNDYYLRHLFQGGYNIGGCVFLDCENAPDFTDRHSILYGHRMDDGSMFTDIQKYAKQSFYDAHPYGLLLTPDGNYVVEFFSGYVTEVTGNCWRLRFGNDEEFQTWLNDQVAHSDFQANFTPSAGDRVLTLSTCSHAFSNARYILHGVIRSSENG